MSYGIEARPDGMAGAATRFDDARIRFGEALDELAANLDSRICFGPDDDAARICKGNYDPPATSTLDLAYAARDDLGTVEKRTYEWAKQYDDTEQSILDWLR